MKITERRCFCLLAIIVIVTAWNSYDFYHEDEHFQILEFGGSKLGIVPEHDLPWEYKAGIRPWLQPTLFVGICKILQFSGVENRFLWTFFFRLFCAAWGFYAMLCVYRMGAALLKDESAQRNHLILCTTLGFLPFLLVRTSSENMSTSFFTIGMVLLLKSRYDTDSERRMISPGIRLLAGLLLGLAFQFRYQTIIMTVGLCLWLLFIAGTRWKHVALISGGFLSAVWIGMLADRYGNGRWTFPFFDYFRVNLLENKTVEFGTYPFFAYLYLPLANVFILIVPFLMVSLFILWIQKPKHALTWITLPFFIFHCFIGHKDERFLFPMIPAAILSLQLVFSKDGRQVLPAFFQTGFWRGSYKWIWRYNWCWLIFLSVFPFNIDFNINHQKFIYNHRGGGDTYYAVDFNPYRSNELVFSFYRPENLHMVEVENLSSMADIARNNTTREIYFFSRMPYLDNWPDALAQRTTVANASHFFFRWPWVVKTFTPTLKYIQGIINGAQCPTLFRIAPQDELQ